MRDLVEQVVKGVLEAGIQTLVTQVIKPMSEDTGKKRALDTVRVLLDKEVEVRATVVYGK